MVVMESEVRSGDASQLIPLWWLVGFERGVESEGPARASWIRRKKSNAEERWATTEFWRF